VKKDDNLITKDDNLITQEQDRQEVIAAATLFTCVAFRGRGVFDHLTFPTLDEARAAAPSLHRDRPVGIYATAYSLKGAAERRVHVENWEPNPKPAPVRESNKSKEKRNATP
jgi:hypothetical protein